MLNPTETASQLGLHPCWSQDTIPSYYKFKSTRHKLEVSLSISYFITLCCTKKIEVNKRYKIPILVIQSTASLIRSECAGSRVAGSWFLLKNAVIDISAEFAIATLFSVEAVKKTT
jgi:hypothetical protein